LKKLRIGFFSLFFKMKFNSKADIFYPSLIVIFMGNPVKERTEANALDVLVGYF